MNSISNSVNNIASLDRNRPLFENGVPPRSSKRKGYVPSSADDAKNLPDSASKPSEGINSIHSTINDSDIHTNNSVNDTSNNSDHTEIPNALSSKKPEVLHHHPQMLQKTASESYLSNSRRIRSNTVGWSGAAKSSHINVPSGYSSGNGFPTINSGSSGLNISVSNTGGHGSNNSGNNGTGGNSTTDSNVEKSNAYFRRLSTLPEKKPNIKQKYKITFVSRKLLFAFSEIYSAFKRFNVIGNNDRAVQERMAMTLSLAKRQINHLVEVLENVEDKDNDEMPRSPEIICRVISKNIQVFKEAIQYLANNIKLFTDRADVCFIRMLLLSLFGCYSEIYNAWIALNGGKVAQSSKSSGSKPPLRNKFSSSLASQGFSEVPLPNIPVPTNTSGSSSASSKPKISASTQISIPATSSKSHLAGARISVVDPKDEKLYGSSQSAITTAQRVCKIIMDAIDKPENKSHAGVEELLINCSQIQDVSRKLDSTLASLTRSVFDNSNSEEQYNSFVVEQEKYKRIFLTDFDSFITKVIRILAIFKLVMNDFPELRLLRADMSLLSRTAKELIAIFKPEAKNESATGAPHTAVKQ